MDPRIAGTQIATIGMGTAPHGRAVMLRKAYESSRDICCSIDETYGQPVPARSCLIEQKPHGPIIIAHIYIDASIVVDIAKRCAAADFGKL